MLKKDIENSIKRALKERNSDRLRVLRFILSQIKYKEIDKSSDLTDEEIVTLLLSEVKKRREAITLFKKGNRQDLVDREEKDIKVIKEYLPPPLSEEELKAIIDKTIKSVENNANPGKIIGQVLNQVKGRADGTTIARLVNEKIK